MCAQFGIEIPSQKLEASFGIKLNISMPFVLNKRVSPYTEAPVFVFHPTKKSFQLAKMQYSLVPAWSSEPKVKFATYNARLDTVLEKPTWKTPFIKNHCLIPLSYFVESVYEGPFAGHVLSFSSAENEVIFAAGIYDFWQAKADSKMKQSARDEAQSQGFYSFAILTTEPGELIQKAGHDRSPVFLNAESGKEWLKLGSDRSGSQMIEFLKSSHLNLPLKIEKERPLRPGWESRK